mmetsp:Transcript_10680/g.17938  ORF Transcript_10680/g.17938 Transcript_10680/m.17938 type:complete len:118 (+) Transcript_10680:284-637(+)
MPFVKVTFSLAFVAAAAIGGLTYYNNMKAAELKELRRCKLGTLDHLFGICVSEETDKYKEQLRADMIEDWNFFLYKESECENFGAKFSLDTLTCACENYSYIDTQIQQCVKANCYKN